MPIDKRIDYIFTMDFKVLSFHHIDERLNDNNHISDHLPVLIHAQQPQELFFEIPKHFKLLNLLYTTTDIKKEFSKISSILLLTGLSYSQELVDINFGDNYSLDVATWNIEWFPKNGQTTSNHVSDIIRNLDLDIIAIQEVDDTVMFDLMVDDLQDYSGYYESAWFAGLAYICLLYTSPSPRDLSTSRMPSSA